MPAGVGLEQRLARPTRPARPCPASPGAPLHCMRILSKGPEYLRLHFEGSQRGRVSVRERLEADRAKYVKPRCDGEPSPPQGGGGGGACDGHREDDDDDDEDEVDAANGTANGGGQNLNLEVLNNAINDLQRSPCADRGEGGHCEGGGRVGPEPSAPPCWPEASEKPQGVDSNGNDGSVFKAGHVKFLRRFFQGMGSTKEQSLGLLLPSGGQPMKSSPEHRPRGKAENEEPKVALPEFQQQQQQHLCSQNPSSHHRHHHHHQRGLAGEPGVLASTNGTDVPREPKARSSETTDVVGSRRRPTRPMSLPESAFVCRSGPTLACSSSPPPALLSASCTAPVVAGRGADTAAAFFDGCGVEPPPTACLERARSAHFEATAADLMATESEEGRGERHEEGRACSSAQWDDPDFDGLSARRSSAGPGEGPDADPDLADHSPSMVSVIERNARIIKWLYSCRQALAGQERQPRN
ncbi:protein FAM110B-like [Lethenteron reissneri]|uniref:protein FAM110B-like n=1 Tax=Lethenteron reissneri TaxID=7753 RepID=UPI002AB60901|nr:protein FAM110B-like [Lethenteron reissneri]XP_061425418.1 protein FAM110B-like [Lethenteron reissneri]XP_061425419.1 protein FAM110B-like [Lethenteron reissneri]XP_061425420.1 protein FAM110B-like [Lethenteron reissneri]XP_061425421.1 protein FAM110B-like [Lethenteron reissneri]